jgi:hypothetical protein
MHQIMVSTLPIQGANGTVRRVRISLPLVPCLLDGQKYFLPGDLAAPAGEELRPIARPRLERTPQRRLDCFDPKQRRERVRVLVADGMSQTEAAVILGVGKTTVSRDLAELGHSIGDV